MNKAYKDGACGRIGFNFTIRQSSPRTCQVGTAFSSWTITCIAAQVAVCSKGLSRTVTHLEGQTAVRDSPEDCQCQLELYATKRTIFQVCQAAAPNPLYEMSDILRTHLRIKPT